MLQSIESEEVKQKQEDDLFENNENLHDELNHLATQDDPTNEETKSAEGRMTDQQQHTATD